MKPLELAQQMTLDVANAWGVLHAILDTCMEQPEGKYLILKDPNQVRRGSSLPGSSMLCCNVYTSFAMKRIGRKFFILSTIVSTDNLPGVCVCVCVCLVCGEIVFYPSEHV